MQNVGQTVSGLEVAQEVWHRRKWLALLAFAAVLFATVAVARNLANVYESTVTVLVERPQVPQRLVRQSEDSQLAASFELETRLRTLSQQILSRSRLSELITRFDLYPDLRQRATPDMLAERMRRDVRLQFKEVNELIGLNPTFAFNLSYMGHDPETVAQVANALAKDFVDESARIREQQTAGTTDFLRAQLDEAGRKLQTQERQISEFTKRHNGGLPEQQAANLAALGRLNAQIVAIMDRQRELNRQLAEFPGVVGPARLAKLRQELADLRTRDTEQHPDVVRVKQEIADLERQLSAEGGGGAAAANSTAPQLKDPRATLEAEIAALRNEEQVVRRQIATYEQRVEDAPLREQEFQQLSRDYAAAKDLYQSLLQRYQDAQLTARVAQQNPQGEQFSILDPAVASRQPVGPHRLRLLLMGLVGGLGAAVGASLLAEVRDTSFHTIDGLRAFTSVPVLVTIPSILTEADARRRRRRFGLALLAAALAIAAVIGASAHFARSNDGLVFLLTRDECLRPGVGGRPVPPCAEWMGAEWMPGGS
jgi:polysaccharide biosynthesis transport protein